MFSAGGIHRPAMANWPTHDIAAPDTRLNLHEPKTGRQLPQGHPAR
ncbi:hypothetical protein SAMN05444421_10662 [Celeribacter marinus]|nr:hypothetical protein SAMN05444421_10662 [Celeribacter marinus]